MNKLLNIMRREAMRQGDGKAHTAIGLVDAYNHNNYTSKVKLMPEELLTGWLPLAAEWVGNGWGMFCPPSIGDMVVVEFVDGDLEAGVITKRLYNDSDRPLPVLTGEFWLVHQAGAFVKLTNDGKITAQDEHGTVLQLSNDGAVRITGNLIVTGDISDQNGARGTLQHVRDNYDVHTHGGVQPGAGSTGGPSNVL